MLFNKTISIRKKSRMEVDDNGIPTYTWTEAYNLKADIQPITDAKVRKTHGEYDNVQYKVYINKYIDLNTSDYKVVYNSKEYIIKSIIGYDDDILPYMELLIGDRNEN